MISFYAPGQPGRTISDPNDCALMTPDAVWIDLLELTQVRVGLLKVAGIKIHLRQVGIGLPLIRINLERRPDLQRKYQQITARPYAPDWWRRR